MTTPLPPGWYPNPNGGSDKLYWDGLQWHSAPPPGPSTDGTRWLNAPLPGPSVDGPRWHSNPPPGSRKKQQRWPWVIGGVVLLVILVSRCSGGGKDEGTPSTATTTTATTTTTARAATASDGQIATAARQYVLQSFGIPPGSDFIDYECPPADAGTANCWVPYVTKFTYSSGVLRVFMQVDRRSLEGKELGENAAHAIMNFIKLGPGPSVVTNNVNWVEAVDGTGVHIAQYSL